MSPCKIHECHDPTVAVGLCSKHYQRFKKYGDPLVLSRNAPMAYQTCLVDSCDAKPIAQGYCPKHYRRASKYGDPLKTKFIKARDGEPENWIRSVALIFHGKECLTYPYANAKGYGQLWVSGKKFPAHRLVCLETHGDPPSERHVAAHTCGNSLCVNPSHLSWKTPAENEADKLVHGTHQRGERNATAKLKEYQVLKIFEAEGHHKKIAAQFGVSRRTVGAIKTKKNWAWLTGDAA